MGFTHLFNLLPHGVFPEGFGTCLSLVPAENLGWGVCVCVLEKGGKGLRSARNFCDPCQNAPN